MLYNTAMDINYLFTKNNLYFSFAQHELKFSFYPVIFGFERCSPNKEPVLTQTKKYHVLHFVLEGSGTLHIENKNYLVQKNQIFYIPPFSEASYRQSKTAPWQYMWIEFTGENSDYFCRHIGLSSSSPVLTPNDAQNIANLFATVIEISMNKLYSENSPKSVAALINLFTGLYEDKTTYLAETNKQMIKLQNVMDYIHTNFCDSELSLQSIANHTYFNKTYLCRIFKQTYGISPQLYLINLRMQKAKEMMRHSSFSISDIALAVGYKSPYYFSKEFKRLFSVTPSQYIASLKA